MAGATELERKREFGCFGTGAACGVTGLLGPSSGRGSYTPDENPHFHMDRFPILMMLGIEFSRAPRYSTLSTYIGSRSLKKNRPRPKTVNLKLGSLYPRLTFGSPSAYL